MTWNLAQPVVRAPGATAATFVGGTWIFRGVESVFGCAPGDAEPRWEEHFGPESMALGTSQIARAGSVAVTIVGDGFDAPVRVVAFRPEGTIAWEHERQLRVGAYGVASARAGFLLQGTDHAFTSHVVTFDPATGSELGDVATEIGSGVRVADDVVYVPTMGGLFVVEGAKGEPRQLSPLAANVNGAAHGAFFAFSESESAVVRVTPEGGETRVPVQDGSVGRVVGLYPLREPNRVLLAGEGGSVVVDFGAKKVVATLALPQGRRTGGAVDTAHGVAVLEVDASYSGTVGVYDASTGERMQGLPLEDTLPDGVFWLGDRLVVSSGGIRFFERAK